MLPCGRADGLDTGAGGFVCAEGGPGFGCVISCCATAGAADGEIAEMPAASSSRKRCARVVAADDVVATRTDDGCVIALAAGNGSNVTCGPLETDRAEALAAVVEDVADSVAVFTVYDRTRTISAVANATVSNVRKTERNEIWTRRRT
jgi:hypothetical protein